MAGLIFLPVTLLKNETPEPVEKNMTAAFLMQLPETLTIISSVMGFFAIIAGVKHTGIFRKMGVFGFISEAATVLYHAG